MSNQTLDLSQPVDTTRLLLKLVDNLDGTFSIAVSGTLDLGTTDNAVLDSIVTQLQGMNLQSSVIFDSIVVTYTGTDKGTISKVEWKLGAATVKTLTPTFATLTDTWTKS